MLAMHFSNIGLKDAYSESNFLSDICVVDDFGAGLLAYFMR